MPKETVSRNITVKYTDSTRPMKNFLGKAMQPYGGNSDEILIYAAGAG